jgi:hypothetical protein
MTNTVYPLGYSAAGTEQHIAELMEQPHMLLIDTRKKPYSWREAWRKEALQEKWDERYKWAGAYLGNKNYNNGFPIEIVNPQVGIRGLQMYLDEGHDLILLCECQLFASCHRKVIVEKLQEARPGVQVVLPEEPALRTALAKSGKPVALPSEESEPIVATNPYAFIPENLHHQRLHERCTALNIDWQWLQMDTFKKLIADENMSHHECALLHTRLMTFESQKKRTTARAKVVPSEQVLQQELL